MVHDLSPNFHPIFLRVSDIMLCSPMIALTTHDRMTQFMEDAILNSYFDSFSSGAAKEVLAKASEMLDDSSEVKRSFKATREELRLRTLRFKKLRQKHLGQL